MDRWPGADLRGDHPVTDPGGGDPHLAHIQYFPVKSLDPEVRDSATLVADGALAGDRRWAILDRPPGAAYNPAGADVGGAGDFVNGKKTARVHRLRSRFVPTEAGGPAVEVRAHRDGGTSGERGETGDWRRFDLSDGASDRDEATVHEPLDDWRRFDLSDGASDRDEATVHEPLDDWLGDFFEREVSVRRTDAGQHDDRERHGPTVVSTATLREVAAWFEFDLASARRRFRANLEVGGVPPFWEDRLFGDTGEVVAFRIGEATLHGVHPCARCVVPGRDPDTGVETPGFRTTFVSRRRATEPAWTPSDRFDHDFRMMVNTRVPAESVGLSVAVGDGVEILGTRS